MCKLNIRFLNKLLAGAAVLALPIALTATSVDAQAQQYRGWGFSGAQKASYWEQPSTSTEMRRRELQPPIGLPTLSKANIKPMIAAIKRYSEIVARGGWKPIPMIQLRAGMRAGAVALLRSRLLATGDITPQYGRPDKFDNYLEQALARFQDRHGLPPSGIADKSTLMALNVSAKARLRQLKVNLSRLRTLSARSARKYVMVNIPAAQIEAVDNDIVVSRHSAVVGKVDRQSPLLKSAVHEINFNPYWHVPASIVRKDLVPKARRYAKSGKDILSTYRIDAFDGKGRKLNPAKINWSSNAVYGYSYRQQPWKDNSMGFVKINFHNKHSVYLHDTPSKSLFSRNYRAQSSGCVRVQNVGQLVSWMLASNGGWDNGRVMRMKETGERKDVRLKKKMPVYMVYLTAWATKDGALHFRRDLYRRDGVGVMASAY